MSNVVPIPQLNFHYLPDVASPLTNGQQVSPSINPFTGKSHQNYLHLLASHQYEPSMIWDPAPSRANSPGPPPLIPDSPITRQSSPLPPYTDVEFRQAVADAMSNLFDLFRRERTATSQLERLFNYECRRHMELNDKLEALVKKLDQSIETVEGHSSGLAHEAASLKREIADRKTDRTEVQQALATIVYYIEDERKRCLVREGGLGFPVPEDINRLANRRSLFFRIIEAMPHSVGSVEATEDENQVREFFEREAVAVARFLANNGGPSAAAGPAGETDERIPGEATV
ncbi:hypothetical protein V5O48_017381 [Marasmius crinis-equi]|uniref:Uncharacterized protein n=1 Tax=Marasmius crinis-equi TaxID=585013 RepID=A0ABR3EP31_9AGAR